MKRFATIVALVVAVAAQGASAQTLKAVKDRGMLNCGANGTLAGFGLPDAQGKWTGIDNPPPIDVKALIDNMGDRVPFQGMAAVGR